MNVYNHGHKCSVCGRHLDSYDSFSIKFKDGKEIIKCLDCDL